MTYRNDVDALEARHAALEAALATATKERDLAGQLLEEAKVRAKLPLLDNIRVATPCTADWNQMSGDERVRACGACNKNVYNISNMTRDEAQALLLQHEGSMCVRYFQRADGTIILADCTIGKAQKRKRRVIAAGATAMLAGGGFVAYESRTSEPLEKNVHVFLGEAEASHAMPPPLWGPEPPPVAVMGGASAEPLPVHTIKMGKVHHVDPGAKR